MTLKAHTCYIILDVHPYGGSFPPFPIPGGATGPMSSHPVSFTSFTSLVFLFPFLSRAHFMFSAFRSSIASPTSPVRFWFAIFFILSFPSLPSFPAFPFLYLPAFPIPFFPVISSHSLSFFLFVFLERKEWGICWQFLPARRYASAGTIAIWPCVCVCLSVSLSVCLFVTSQRSIEMDRWLEIELFFDT